jgi:peroxiredoxin
MKRNLLPYLLMLTITFPLIVMSQNNKLAEKKSGIKEKNNYNIRITAKGLKEGDQCLLAYYNWDKQYIKDTSKANANGEVIFKGNDTLAQGIYLFVIPSKRYFDFIVSKEQDFSLETDTVDFVKNLKIKGSNENKLFNEYQQYLALRQKDIEPLRAEMTRLGDKKDSVKLVQDKMAKIDKEVKEYKLAFIKNNPNTLISKIFRAMSEPDVPEAPTLPNGKKDSTFAYRYFKSHYFDEFDFTDDRLLHTPIFFNKIKFYIEKLTPPLPDSINVTADYLIEKARPNPEVFKYIVWYITSTYENPTIMGMDAVFVHMVEKYYATYQTPWMDSTQYSKIITRAYTLKPLLLGKKAQNITMIDTTGKTTSLYDLKSKYTVLVFWDHACGHCRKEIPKLATHYKEKLKAKGLEVFAVETEDKPDEWKKFIRENKLNWINVHQPDEYKRAVTKKIYDIYSTPVIYLLDENKIIKAKRIDSDQLEDFIDRLEKDKLEKEKENKSK